MTEHLPLIVIELVLVFGGTLAFAWWQLRDLKKLRKEREAREAAAGAASPHLDKPSPPPEQTPPN